MSNTKVSIWIAVMTVSGGIIGSVVTAVYQDEVSKRQINIQVIELLVAKILDEKPVVLTRSLDRDQMNQIFGYKDNAFLVRQITQHLADNHSYIDFAALSSALTSIERRYSYAKIYEYSGLSSTICENLVLNTGGGKEQQITLSKQLAKCSSSELDGISLTLSQIDLENYRFKLAIAEDHKGLLCPSGYCSFWVDLGDRLESTNYQYLVLAEYMGMNSSLNEDGPVAAFSIIKRMTPSAEAEG